ncbi:MAG: hypothetical protein QM809_18640 [Gordonia sp. (in: high G+C Gram-positive bacteria)]|uniref:hypothetical protein n=1 Tax=Gordonia sp. (in: high G+C Gram-positive bacteria) TaxID=84139 RepID=UPI0039E23DE2
MSEAVSAGSERAKTADRAADELDRLIEDSRLILTANDYGVDCVEGVSLFDGAKELLSVWRAEAHTLVMSVKTLASDCRRSVAAYAASDE